MPLRYSLFLLLALGLCSAARAQQPFARFGVKVEVLSLSNGRYPEFFPNDSLRRVGSVVYNRRLHRIAYLLPPDSLLGRAKSEVTSRWWVVDPHAENYVNITPYAYVANNPVNHTDPDGRDIIYNSSSATNKKTGVTTVTVTANVTMKVLNNANMDSRAFNSKVAAFGQELRGALSGETTVGKTHYVFKAGKVDVQAASSMKDVRATDHLMVFVNDVKARDDKGGDAGGITERGGRVSYVEPGQSTGSMVHEFGHDMGLRHNWRTPETQDDGAGNYMSYEANRSSFSGSQLMQSFFLGGQGQLNQGSNSSTPSVPTTHQSTTQTDTYYKAAEGEKVPRPLYGTEQ